MPPIPSREFLPLENGRVKENLGVEGLEVRVDEPLGSHAVAAIIRG